jgi:hypothetical protein
MVFYTVEGYLSRSCLEPRSRPVICYIDAMDECRYDDIENIVHFFDNLGDALMVEEKRFLVCLSSRHYPHITFSKSIGLVLEDQQGHDVDVQHYIQQRLLIDGGALKQDLSGLINSKAYGVFLWVVLVVALVNQDDRQGRMQGIYARLDRIPPKLSDLFNGLIIRGTNSEYLRPLLQWVAFSRRPLTPTELYCILMHAATQPSPSPSALEQRNLAKFILDASKGLVETTFGMYPKVQFVHESLRTYFIGEGIVHLTSQVIADSTHGSRPGETKAEQTQTMAGCCHDQLKERCLGYLMEIIPFPLHNQRNRLREYLSTSYPFCKYAIYGVTSHAESALDCGQQQEDFIIAVPWSWLGVLHEIADYENVGWQERIDTAPWYKAYVAAKLGHTKLLKAVLETLSPSEVVPWQWGAIICASTEISDSEGVSAALQAGADPRKPTSSEYRSCLRYAIEHACRNEQRGNSLHTQGWDIVELLVKHGVRSYATSDGDANCIYEACRDHDVENLRILLGERLRADTTCSEYSISLARAVGRANYNGNDEIIQLLLDKGAEANLWPRAKLETEWYPNVLQVTFRDLTTARFAYQECTNSRSSPEYPKSPTLRFQLHPSGQRREVQHNQRVLVRERAHPRAFPPLAELAAIGNSGRLPRTAARYEARLSID